jgi:hypothetical protein
MITRTSHRQSRKRLVTGSQRQEPVKQEPAKQEPVKPDTEKHDTEQHDTEKKAKKGGFFSRLFGGRK